MKVTMTKHQIRIARAIANAADQEGTIQAWDILDLQRRGIIPNDPRQTTTMSMDYAWQLAGLDPEQCREALFG